MSEEASWIVGLVSGMEAVSWTEGVVSGMEAVSWTDTTSDGGDGDGGVAMAGNWLSGEGLEVEIVDPSFSTETGSVEEHDMQVDRDDTGDSGPLLVEVWSVDPDTTSEPFFFSGSAFCQCTYFNMENIH